MQRFLLMLRILIAFLIKDAQQTWKNFLQFCRNADRFCRKCKRYYFRKWQFWAALFPVEILIIVLVFAGIHGFQRATGQSAANTRAAQLEAVWCVELLLEHFHLEPERNTFDEKGVLFDVHQTVNPELDAQWAKLRKLDASVQKLHRDSIVLLARSEELRARAEALLVYLKNTSEEKRLFFQLFATPKPVQPPPVMMSWVKEAHMLTENPAELERHLTKNKYMRHFLLKKVGKHPET